MQSIINEALKNAEIEKEMSKSPNSTDDDFIGQPRIVIIGCGGAGNNTINRLHHMGVSGAETIAINTDKQHLDMIQGRQESPDRQIAYKGTWRWRLP